MTRLLSRLRDFGSAGLPNYVLQWSQRVCEQIEAAFAGQQSQVNAINAILDPNTLTPDKKPVWMFMETYLTGEQSDLDAKATAYGITTEKTAYDNAVSALTAYLATLTSAVAWNDTSGNTAIIDATFRGKFTDVLTTKQALLNKMHSSAKTLADGAQSTANTGVANAATAQSTANTGVTNAAAAQSTANTVVRNHAINTGYTAPGTVLTATDAGSDATVTIAAHSRVYGDISNVSVSGGSVTGLSYSTDYYLYYDQSSRAGGAVTYHADTNANHALPSAAAGRHFVGKVTTPASGGGATTGGSTPPSGGSGLGEADIHSTL